MAFILSNNKTSAKLAGLPNKCVIRVLVSNVNFTPSISMHTINVDLIYLLWHKICVTYTYWKCHMDLVKSSSMRLNTASTSPLGSRSGIFSTCQRAIRANPCCGPNAHCPNWAVKVHNSSRNFVLFLIRSLTDDSEGFFCLRKSWRGLKSLKPGANTTVQWSSDLVLGRCWERSHRNLMILIIQGD